MTYKAKWQNFRERDWDEIRDAWLASVPTFPGIGAPPDPGLEHLSTLIAIDLPVIRPDSKTKQKAQQARRATGLPQFEEFRIVRLPSLEQRYLWEAFQRVLRMSVAQCLDKGIRQELLNLSYESISPPRNHFLYEAHFWPLGDLMSDASVEEMDSLIGTELDTGDEGFLLRLSFCVYRLFEQLMSDLAEQSPVIKIQFDGSRSWVDSAEPEFGRYRTFLSQSSSEAGAIN